MLDDFSIVDTSLEEFIGTLRTQFYLNKDKWGYEHDEAHTTDEWLDILAEQVEHLYMAHNSMNDKDLLKEIFHVTAVLADLFIKLSREELYE